MPAPVIDVPTIEQSIRVDGVLDEAAWGAATPVVDLRRYIPTQGGPPAGRTEVRFLQDDDTLYVGVRVEATPQVVRARVSPRERVDSDDQIGLYLDPYHDARQGFIFYFSALGIQQDIRFDNGAWDMSWDTVLRSRGTVDPDGRGYTLEIALPFRSLKYAPSRDVQEWGVILTRKIPGEGAKFGFPELVRNHPAWFTQAATLRVAPPSRGSGLEVIPGLTLGQQGARPDPDAPLAWTPWSEWSEVARPSLDLRFGPSPGTALVATVNPDFSQVESDVVPVSLNRRFAFRFPEQRPFFTEGANFLVDEVQSLYTRTIVEPLYGLKLAGRDGAWSIGLLHALDRSPAATVHEDGTPGFNPEDVEGRCAVNTVLRLRRDLPGAGQLGLTWTDRHLAGGRDRLAGATPATRQPHGHADTLGLDLTLRMPRRWQLQAWHDQSLVATADTLLGGANTGARATRPSGAGLGLTAQASYLTKGYRQELGFRPQSGYLDASVDFDWTLAGRGLLSTVTPGARAFAFDEVTGDHLYGGAGNLEVLLAGVHRLTVEAGASHRRELLDDLDARVTGWWLTGAWSGQIGAAVELTPRFEVGQEMDFRDLQPARKASVQLDTTLRPARPLRIDLLGRFLRYERAPSELALARSDDILVRGRAQWQITRDWGVRLIAAWNRVDRVTGPAETLESSAMVTWLLHPFTAVYLGYAQLDTLGDDPTTLSRSVFLKAHVWWRP